MGISTIHVWIYPPDPHWKVILGWLEPRLILRSSNIATRWFASINIPTIFTRGSWSTTSHRLDSLWFYGVSAKKLAMIRLNTVNYFVNTGVPQNHDPSSTGLSEIDGNSQRKLGSNTSVLRMTFTWWNWLWWRVVRDLTIHNKRIRSYEIDSDEGW